MVEAQTRSFIRSRRVGGAGRRGSPLHGLAVGRSKEKKQERRRGGGGRRERELEGEEEEEEEEKRGRKRRRKRRRRWWWWQWRWLCFSCWLLLLLGGAERCGLINFV